MNAATRTTVPGSVRAGRAVGAVVVSAAGDALGAGYEFGPALSPETPVAMKGGGGFHWEPGEWTDDTQMALAILLPLAEGDTDLARIEASFRAWFESGPPDVGNQTRGALNSTGPLADAAAAHLALTGGRAAGNGSLMRTGPVALAHPGDRDAIADLARAVSELTHPAADCVDACVLWSLAIDHAIHHAPTATEPWDAADAVRAGLTHLPEDRRDQWASLVDEADGADPGSFTNNGWVVHAFQAALAAITSTPVPDGDAAPRHLRLTLERAVRVGGDTDTVAAITGSLLGARWGVTALPFAWRRLIHGRVTATAPALRTADLEHLARLAFNGGEPDPTGWPGAASLLGHYRDTFGVSHRPMTLGDVVFGTVFDLEGAVHEGVDAVISLCRMGTHDVPADIEHHTLGLLDTSPDDNPNLVHLLDELTAGIEELHGEDKRVFVHCVQAENRTPTAAAAWLVRTGATPDEALRSVAARINQPRSFLSDAVRRLPPR